jgi:GNAT superfamily N-acetyltransferase
MPTDVPFKIRRAGAADAAEILSCLAAAFAPYRDRYTPQAYRDTVLTADSIGLRLREMCVLVAVAKRTIAGTIGYRANGEEGHLRGMAVLPEWRGSGMAPALLQSAEAELLRLGCRRVTLDSTDPLERAARFYRKYGYAPTGRTSDFFGMPLAEYAKPL